MVRYFQRLFELLVEIKKEYSNIFQFVIHLIKNISDGNTILTMKSEMSLTYEQNKYWVLIQLEIEFFLFGKKDLLRHYYTLSMISM